VARARSRPRPSIPRLQGPEPSAAPPAVAAGPRRFGGIAPRNTTLKQTRNETPAVPVCAHMFPAKTCRRRLQKLDPAAKRPRPISAAYPGVRSSTGDAAAWARAASSRNPRPGLCDVTPAGTGSIAESPGRRAHLELRRGPRALPTGRRRRAHITVVPRSASGRTTDPRPRPPMCQVCHGWRRNSRPCAPENRQPAPHRWCVRAAPCGSRPDITNSACPNRTGLRRPPGSRSRRS